MAYSGSRVSYPYRIQSPTTGLLASCLRNWVGIAGGLAICISCSRRRVSITWLRESPLQTSSFAQPTDAMFRALYVRGSDYETSDAVFGVKESLIVSLDTVTAEQAKEYDVKEGSKLLKYDFVLVTDEETKQLRHDEAVKAMKILGREGMMIVNGLVVPEVD